LSGQRLGILFERKRGDGRLYVCEGGPLGTIGVPAGWTNLSPAAAERPLTIEVLIELARVVAALKSGPSAARAVDGALPAR
jgi:hypothetical protein